MELSSIVVFPIKSCRGIAVSHARVEKRGLAGDRRWMLVDERGRFFSQREEPRLALVDVGIEGEAIVASQPDAGELRLPRTHEDGERVAVEVWSRPIHARVHDEGSRWFSAWLGRPLRLVHLPDGEPSPLASKRALPGEEVSFADGYPLLACTLASLDALGDRIEGRGGQRVPMSRFRPNLVVRGGAAWDEDAWGTLEVGSVGMRAPKPCERCVMTTIDPSTARLGAEPLRTLASFRRRENGVWFGVNLAPTSLGTIALGDPVHVVERIEPPAFDAPARAS